MQALADLSKSEIGKEGNTKTPGVKQQEGQQQKTVPLPFRFACGFVQAPQKKDEIEMGRRRIETHRCAQ